MSKLKLTKEGLKSLEWDGDLKSEHRIKKQDGRRVVINKKTKEVVFSADTVEEAEVYFWREEEIHCAWSKLRDLCEIEEGFTLKDLFRIIEEDDALEVFFGSMYGTINLDQFVEERDTPKFLDIRRIGQVHPESGIFAVTPVLNCIPSRTSTGHLPLNLDTNFMIYDKKDDFFLEGEWTYSLLDVIDSIFAAYWERPTVTFKKDGLVNEFNEPITEAFPYLMYHCEIDEDVTLNDIFEYVASDETLKTFIGIYSWCSEIDEFHEAAKEPKKQSEHEEQLHCLRLNRYGDNKHNKDGPYFEITDDFHGIGELTEETKEYYVKHPELTSPKDQVYAIELCPMNSIAHLPMKLGEKIHIKELDKEFKLLKELDCKTQYTLLEVLDGIYWEISFFGSPQQAADQREELSETVAKIKGGEEGTTTFTSVDEMLKEMCDDDDDDEDDE